MDTGRVVNGRRRRKRAKSCSSRSNSRGDSDLENTIPDGRVEHIGDERRRVDDGEGEEALYVHLEQVIVGEGEVHNAHLRQNSKVVSTDPSKGRPKLIEECQKSQDDDFEVTASESELTTELAIKDVSPESSNSKSSFYTQSFGGSAFFVSDNGAQGLSSTAPSTNGAEVVSQGGPRRDDDHEEDALPASTPVPVAQNNQNRRRSTTVLSPGERWRREAWEFIKGECFGRDGGSGGADGVRVDTVTVWLRTLLEQNSILLDTIKKMKEKSKDKSEEPFDSEHNHEGVNPGIDDEGDSRPPTRAREVKKRLFDSPLLETMDRIRVDSVTQKDIRSFSTVQWIVNQKQQLNNNCPDQVNQQTGKSFREESEQLLEELTRLSELNRNLEEEKRALQDYADNLKHDVDSLLTLVNRARETGSWDQDDLNFCVVTFQDLFGPSQESSHSIPDLKDLITEDSVEEHSVSADVEYSQNDNKSERKRSSGSRQTSHPIGRNSSHSRPIRKKSESPASSVLTASSRLSVSSDLVAVEKSNARKLSEKEYSQVKALRKEIVELQEKCSQRIKESIEKDKIITQLQLEITELNQESDEMKEENNANLSVINRLKDDLYDARTRLSCSQSQISLSKHESLPSLPEVPSPKYTSKFARNLIRRNSQNTLLQKLSEQLDFTNKAKLSVEEERDSLKCRLHTTEFERGVLEENITKLRNDLEDLYTEHEKLKEDFRTLVRLQDIDNTLAMASKATSVPNISVVERDKINNPALTKKKYTDNRLKRKSTLYSNLM